MQPGLRGFLESLEAHGELLRVGCEVSPLLEVSEIADRVARLPAPRASQSARAFDPAMAGMGGPAQIREKARKIVVTCTIVLILPQAAAAITTPWAPAAIRVTVTM